MRTGRTWGRGGSTRPAPVPGAVRGAVVVAVLVLAAGCRTPTPDDASAPPSSPAAPAATAPSATTVDVVAAVRGDAGPGLVVREARVVEVVDGDTVDLADGTRVRLAIVDTPEVHGGEEACGPQASALTADAVVDEPVLLVRPDGAPRTDPYGRSLAEVVLRDEARSLNVELVAAGLARVDERYTDEDPDLARRARAAASDAPTPPCASGGDT